MAAGCRGGNRRISVCVTSRPMPPPPPEGSGPLSPPSSLFSRGEMEGDRGRAAAASIEASFVGGEMERRARGAQLMGDAISNFISKSVVVVVVVVAAAAAVAAAAVIIVSASA